MVDAEIREQYSTLSDLPEDAESAAKSRRGLAFEGVLNAVLTKEGLEPRVRYRPNGEEIDGSFVLEGRVFLLEAKWHAKPLPASALYSFKGKVDGKLVGTLGVIISMSGYSKEAVNSLTLGKNLNVLLLDREDVNAVMNGHTTFYKMLRQKVRAAAEEATVYLPMRVAQLRTRQDERGKMAFDPSWVDVSVAAEPAQKTIVVICEGRSDEVVLRALVARILGNHPSAARVHIAAALGKLALPHLASTLYSMSTETRKFIIVADSDGDIRPTEAMIRDNTLVPDPEVIVIHPELESWLVDDMIKAAALKASRRRNLDTYLTIANNLDMEALEKRSRSFQQFRRAIMIAAIEAVPDAGA